MGTFRCVPSTPLEGEVRVAELAEEFPPTHVVKGMFFKPLVDALGPAGWAELAPSLRWPPRDGHYMAFKDYRQRDHLMLIAAIARKRYPRKSLREAFRCLARDDIRTFAESTFGGIMFTLVGDARAALHKFPMVYERVAKGDWTITASDGEDGLVHIEFDVFYGDWAYPLGQLEGIVLHYGGSPRTTVHELGGRRIRFDVQT